MTSYKHSLKYRILLSIIWINIGYYTYTILIVDFLKFFNNNCLTDIGCTDRNTPFCNNYYNEYCVMGFKHMFEAIRILMFIYLFLLTILEVFIKKESILVAHEICIINS